MSRPLTNLPALHEPDLTSSALLYDEEKDVIRRLHRENTPNATRAAYESDLKHIRTWCLHATGDLLAWPASSDLVLKFIAQHLDPKVMPSWVSLGLTQSRRRPRLYAPSTILRMLSTWSTIHDRFGLANPFANPLVRETRDKLRASMQNTPHSPHAITGDILLRLTATTCGNGLIDKRDRAILLVAYGSGGRRRSEIATLDMAGLSVIGTEPLTYRLDVGATKRSTARESSPVALTGIVAVALKDWLDASGITEGPIFRGTHTGGALRPTAISESSIYVLVRKRLELAGLPGDWASPHGLRAGFLTDAGNEGVPPAAAMSAAQIKDPKTLQIYYRGAQLLDHPATAVTRRLSHKA